MYIDLRYRIENVCYNVIPALHYVIFDFPFISSCICSLLIKSLSVSIITV